MTRFTDKADALVAAWAERYPGTLPSKNAVIMCCAVAEHETNCGDAWNRSGNWGAIQRRTMTVGEKGIANQGGNPNPTDAFEQLHGDSSPINGRYKTWFWAFPQGVVYSPARLSGDQAGAWKLLEVLLDKRPSIKAIIDTIDVQTLALNMYHTHYYEGIHDPRKPGGVDQNVTDYSHALSFTAGRFTGGLVDWQPSAINAGGAPPPGSSPAPANPTALDLTSTLGLQRALNRLEVAEIALREDGVLGPKTREAVQRFQAQHPPLLVDGLVGPLTRAALEKALKFG